MRREIEELHKTIRDLNEEQENLLCLLQEMEVKCKKYAKALKQYGYTELEDDDGEDDEDVDDDDKVKSAINDHSSSLLEN